VPRALAVLAVLAAAAAAGCTSEGAPLPPSTAAPPQRAELGWEERAPSDGPGFVFRVHRFAVTERGWEADVEIVNRTQIVWRTGDRLAVEQSSASCSS
jgi:hypothetical protein